MIGYNIIDGSIVQESYRGESYSEQYFTTYVTVLFDNDINEVVIPIYSQEMNDILNGIQDYWTNNYGN
jgi:hypothetical protein